MGRRDIPATDIGISMARSNVASVSHDISWIVSSSLLRARETASIFSDGSIEVQVSDLWVERDWGPFEGLPKGYRPKDPNPLGVEPWSAFVSRIKIGIKALPRAGLGIVVSHSGVFKALFQLGYRSEIGAGQVPHATPILLHDTSLGLTSSAK